MSMHVTEALASQAAMVLTKQRLIKDLEEMIDSLIELIATAINDKSLYTGGHCRRVPELTSLIVEAAHNSQPDYLKDFNLTDADRYQLKVAGWLHDCGKLTTPESVVDKATKQATLSADKVLNLNISRGTLTEPERNTLQQHISPTISMLDKINFPKHLQKVPEYAERMDGTGYPNKLTREQMSIPAHAMAIADIFEALTAADRPYKEAKKLSEALFILEKMKQENHIDPDIYDAFIQEKVYLSYAKKFLNDYQIDID